MAKKKNTVHTVRGKVGTPYLHKTPYAGSRQIRIIDTESIHFTRSLDDLIDHLVALREKYSDTYTNLYVDYEIGHEGERDYYLCGARPETEIEANIRLENEARLKNAADERDRREFARLQKKFGESKK